MTYQNIVTARSKVKGKYTPGLTTYANSTTIWTEIANILDKNGRPIFVAVSYTHLDVYKRQVELFEQGSQKITREHPAAKTYNIMIKNYNATVKLLSNFAPNEDVKDELLGFIEQK